MTLANNAIAYKNHRGLKGKPISKLIRLCGSTAKPIISNNPIILCSVVPCSRSFLLKYFYLRYHYAIYCCCVCHKFHLSSTRLTATIQLEARSVNAIGKRLCNNRFAFRADSTAVSPLGRFQFLTHSFKLHMASILSPLKLVVHWRTDCENNTHLFYCWVNRIWLAWKHAWNNGIRGKIELTKLHLGAFGKCSQVSTDPTPGVFRSS